MVKLYKNGNDFINENIDLLNKDIFFKPFYFSNCASIDITDAFKYAISIRENDLYAILLADGIHNVLIQGNQELAKNIAQAIYGYGLHIKSILGRYEIVDEVSKELTKLYGGTYKINLDMDVMSCTTMYSDTLGVEKASLADLEQITNYYIAFAKEAINFDLSYEDGYNKCLKELDNYYVIKQDGIVVSMAKKSRNLEDTCSVSNVYTNPIYRGKGLCKKVVGAITNDIINAGKIASLNVDRFNPISNACYKKIGYKREYRQVEIQFSFDYKKMVIAGGCFWCMSKPFYEYDGVKALYSGYTDGFDFNPTYEAVKSNETGHKEAVMIIYDPKTISYKELLTIYFENIDPFDESGQFIDRGSNYLSAVFTNDLEEIAIYDELVLKIEEQYSKKVLVPLINEKPFFMAEEYHQDFHLKNPDKFNLEEEISGRNAFEFIKIK